MKKIEVIQNYTKDYGGATGAIETPVGIFFVNEVGLWQIVSAGSTDVPSSKQQVLTSTLLGSEYFEGVDQTSVDIAYAEKYNCILVTCAKESVSNNLIIGCKLDLNNSLFEINGWNINRFSKDGEDIYGASSVKTTVYKLFEGYDDDGLSVGYLFYQEIPLKTLFHAHKLLETYAGGFLSPTATPTVSFNIYDRNGNLIEDKIRFKWVANESSLDFDEWGSAKWGESSWGGEFNKAGLVESFGGGSTRINDLQRLRIKIAGSDKLRSIFSWIVIKTQLKGAIKRRNFVQLT